MAINRWTEQTASSGPQLGVRELQAQADAALRDQARARRLAPRRPLSRRAHLFLIERLAARAGAGLAAYASVIVFAGVVLGRAAPFRTVLWTAIAFAALYATRDLLSAFRQGESVARRPFRWRANYVAALSVSSAAIGAGPFFLSPTGYVLELAVLCGCAAGIAGLRHSFHLRAALAAFLPAGLLSVAAASQAAGLAGASIAAACVGALTAAIAFIAHARRSYAASRHPRTRPAAQEDAFAPLAPATVPLSANG